VRASADEVALSVEASGGYDLPYPTLEFILPPGETRRLLAPPGAQITAGADGARRVVVPV